MTSIPRERVVILTPWRESSGLTTRGVVVVIVPPRPRSRWATVLAWDAVRRLDVADLRVGGSPHRVQWDRVTRRAAYWTRIRPGEDDEAAAERALAEARGALHLPIERISPWGPWVAACGALVDVAGFPRHPSEVTCPECLRSRDYARLMAEVPDCTCGRPDGRHSIWCAVWEPGGEE